MQTKDFELHQAYFQKLTKANFSFNFFRVLLFSFIITGVINFGFFFHQGKKSWDQDLSNKNNASQCIDHYRTLLQVAQRNDSQFNKRFQGIDDGGKFDMHENQLDTGRDFSDQMTLNHLLCFAWTWSFSESNRIFMKFNIYSKREKLVSCSCSKLQCLKYKSHAWLTSEYQYVNKMCIEKTIF